MVWGPSVSISFSARHTTRQANKLSQCGESPVSKSGYVQRSKSCKGRRWAVTPTRTVEDITCLWKAHNWQSYHRRAPHWLFDVNLPARMLKARLQQGSLRSAAAGPPPNCGTPEQKSFKVIENHRISLKLDCSSFPNVIMFQKNKKIIATHWKSLNFIELFIAPTPKWDLAQFLKIHGTSLKFMELFITPTSDNVS